MVLKRFALACLSLFLAGCGAIEIGFEPTSAPAETSPTRAATLTTRLAAVTLTATGTEPGASPTQTDTVALLDTATPPSDTPPAADCAARHIVRVGDTLMTIGQAYGTDWHEIAAANNLTGSSLIFTGQSLCIPHAARTPNPIPPSSTPTVTATASPTSTDVLTPTVTPTASTTPTPCGTAWFFAPAPADCPADVAQTSSGAAERFERGQMLWVASTDTYFVLFNLGAAPADGRLVFIRLETLPLKPGANTDNRIDETPQPGLSQPIRGFGHIWRDEVYGDFGVLGGQTMRAVIGWAVEPEYAISTTLQCSILRADSGQTCYLGIPGNRVIALDRSAAGDLWQYQIGP